MYERLSLGHWICYKGVVRDLLQALSLTPNLPTNQADELALQHALLLSNGLIISGITQSE